MPLEGLQENLRLGEGLPLTLYEADYDVKGMVRYNRGEPSPKSRKSAVR